MEEEVSSTARTVSEPPLASSGASGDASPSTEKPTVTAERAAVSAAESDPISVAESDQAVEGMLPTPSHSLLDKVVAGRYRVLDKLGEGGMGIVYLAEHVTIEKKIALKVLLHEYAAKPDLKDRFLQEAKAAAKIGHENIVDITDFGTTPDGSVFFAMEFLEGQDLSKAIRKGGPMAWSRAKPILLQICRALGAAHSKGIIHRDMKPENIHLIEREGRADFVKVLDFGIAKMSMEQGEKRLTRTGMIFGTPEYMSPEQAQGNKPDHRVDIYAVGVIMYEMMTGMVPFKADTFMGILTKHIFEKPVPPSQKNTKAKIPGEVEGIILKALAKDRDDRFQSMTEMAAAIAQASGRMTRPTGDHQSLGLRILSTEPTGTPATGPGAVASSGPVGAVRTDAPEASTDLAAGEGVERGKGGLIIGVIVALVVVGGLVTFLALRNGNGGEPQDPTKGASDQLPEKHEITINSSPSGASLYMGAYDATKDSLGKTPVTITLPHGDKRVALTLHLEGYKDKGIELVPNARQVRDVELVQLAAEVPARPDARPLAVQPRPKPRPKPRPVPKPQPKVEPKPKPKPEPKPKPKPEPKPKPKPEPKTKVKDLMNPFAND